MTNSLDVQAFVNLPDTISALPHGRRQCAGTNKSGSQCGRAPIPGGTVCNFHGGKAPQVANAARARLVKNDALAVIAGQEHDPIKDAADALLSLASETIALKDELGRRAGELTDVAVTDVYGGQSIAAVLQAYTGAMKQASDVLVKILKLELQDRQVRVQESQIRQTVAALNVALNDPAAASLEYDDVVVIKRRFAEAIQGSDRAAA